MNILPASQSSSMKMALEILRRGGIVAHATETCYGLACDLSNPQAAQRLFTLKQRPPMQPVSALFASLKAADAYVQWGKKAKELAKKHLPGPLTIILDLREDAPHQLYPTPNGGKTIGIRISSHPVALELARLFGVPISTTSANVHQKPSPYTVEEIVAQYKAGAQPDVILDSGELPKNETSTVVTCLHGVCTVVRPGDLELNL